jgi:hypothetical protein
MQTATDGRWPDDGLVSTDAGPSIAREIVTLHPGSGYYPYALVIAYAVHGSLGRLEQYLDAAQRFPDSPARPYLLALAADTFSGEAGKAVLSHKDEEAAKLYARAADYYRAALETHSVAVKSWATTRASSTRREAEKVAKTH